MASSESVIKSEVKPVGSHTTQKFTKRKFKKYRRNRNRRKARSCSNQVHQPLGNSMQCTWFWQNYYNSLEWIGRHQVGYWKSRALGLEEENNLLHEYIQSLCVCEYEPTDENDCNTTRKDWRKHSKTDQPLDVSEYEDTDREDDEDNFEFEITEDMLDFFEQSIRHKMELKKQREEERKENESDSDDNTLPPAIQVGVKRTQEMQLLYGKAAPMILGMETAMQLSFDRNRDLRQPKLWPNLPLKL